MKSSKFSNAPLISMLAFVLFLLAAWITHIVHCLMAAKYILLVAGALIAPVGVIHGVGLWFGVSW